MATTAFYVTLSFMTIFGCCGNQVTAEADCLKVNQTKLFCPLDSNSSNNLSLSCPVGHTVLIFKASVFQNQIADGGDDCPSAPDPAYSSCMELFNRSYACLSYQCDVSVPRPSPNDSCNEGQGSGARIAVVIYRCQPVFSQFSNATATAIALDSDAVVSNSLIAINSQTLALTGEYVTQTSFFCSAVVPSHAEIIISDFFMYVKYSGDGQAMDGSRECVKVDVLTDDDSDDDVLYTYNFCSDEDPSVVLGCSSAERFLRVSYTNINPNASIIFVIQLQVSHLSKITVQCRNPEFPLILPTSSVEPPNIEKPVNDMSTMSTTTDSNEFPVVTLIIALACGVGGLILAVIVVTVAAITWHRARSRSMAHRPLSETSSISTISDGKQELSLQVETDCKPELIKE